MAERPCAACGRPTIRAWISADVERIFDAATVPGGEWGIWSRSEGLNVVQRARPSTPESRLGAGGHQLHDCPGAAGQQLELGGAA